MMSKFEALNPKINDRVKWIGCKVKKQEYGFIYEILPNDTYRVKWDEGVGRTECVYGCELELI